MPTHSFEIALAEAWPVEKWRGMGVVVAVSGGTDSVALLRGLAVLASGASCRLAVAHFNHRLRADAAADAEFVAELAGRLGLPCEIGEADTAAAARAAGDGIEAAARSERYRFLQSAAERIGARYVATAHTADDQAETILHRIVRGTGVGGLAGMPRVRKLSDAVTLIRPMLGLHRDEVLAYLAHLGQPFREDPTNASHAYTRNRIRHGLLPLLKSEYNQDVVAALLRLGIAARDTQHVVRGLVIDLLESAVVFTQPSPLAGEGRVRGTGRATVDCNFLIGEERHVVRELFVAIWRRQEWPRQAMTFAHWDRLAEMAGPGPSAAIKQTFPGEIAAERNGGILALEKSSPRAAKEPRTK